MDHIFSACGRQNKQYTVYTKKEEMQEALSRTKAMDYAYGVIPYYKDDNNKIQFLIVQHNDGHRGFPKGHKEAKETDEETAYRELQEEVGIHDVKISTHISYTEHYTFTKNKKEIHKGVKYFLGEIDLKVKISLQSEEIANYQIADYQRTKSTISYKESKDIVEKAYTYLLTYHKLQ